MEFGEEIALKLCNDSTEESITDTGIENKGYKYDDEGQQANLEWYCKEETDGDMAIFQIRHPRPDEVYCNNENELSKLKAIEGPNDAFTEIYQSGPAGQASWKIQVKEAANKEPDEFKIKVNKKMNELLITEIDAIFEVFTDNFVNEKQGNRDKTLLWILDEKINDFSAELFTVILLKRGADPNYKDEKGNTSLHHAARKGWTSIVKKILEYNGKHITNNDGAMPVELAINENKNDCATFLIKSMNPVKVRELFQGYENKSCRLKFHLLLDKPKMQDTVLAVLDTMLQPAGETPGRYTVYYNILDGDENGHAPNSLNFDGSKKSCVHKIAKTNNKEVVYHDVVRLLLRRKWNLFARNRFLCQFVFYLIQTAFMTIAFVLGARKSNPQEYDESVDIFRGINEALLAICIIYNLLVEIYQFKRHKLNYFKDYFNYLDDGAILFPLLIIPFRLKELPVQWVFASFGYLCQTLRGLEFAAAFRSTGAYVQILYLIIWKDMIPFGAVFSLFLFSFTGAFYLALRGEEFTTTLVTSSNCSSAADDEICIQNITTAKSSNLDISPHLTKEYYHVLFSSLRIMIHAGDVFDEYFGSNGFEWLGVIIYTVFLFLVITLLLNLLIAQMSDTYTNVQSDAQRSLFINRAWIVAKIEHSSLFASGLFNYRKKHYENMEQLDKPQDILDTWEAPPITQMSKEMKKLRDVIKQQEAATIQLINEVRKEVILLRKKIEQEENPQANDSEEIIHRSTEHKSNSSEAASNSTQIV